jgi:DNA-binding transcriptional ArsR family regulator
MSDGIATPAAAVPKRPAGMLATEMEVHATDAENFLRSIANRHRLMVLCTLIEGEMSAGDLSRLLELTQSNLSRHLATLRDAGLVATRREGTTIHYRVLSDRVQMILEVLHHMFCDRLEA